MSVEDRELSERFREVELFMTPNEISHLQGIRDKDKYDHDLIGAIQTGYRRKVEDGFQTTAKIMQRDLYLRGVEWTPEKTFWHMACRLVDWSLKLGVPKDVIVERLRRIADNTERERDRENK